MRRYFLIALFSLAVSMFCALPASAYDLATLKLRQQARAIVVAAMHEDDTFVRSLAIRALADLNDRSSFPVIRLALLGDDKGIKYLAFRTLYQLGDPSVSGVLLPAVRVPSAAKLGLRRASFSTLLSARTLLSFFSPWYSITRQLRSWPFQKSNCGWARTSA